MRKTYTVFLLVIMSVGVLFAGKKILRLAMKCNLVTYTNVASKTRTTGRIYRFQMAVFMPNIKIDQVWFGDTPVPCEVYKMPGRIRVDTCLLAGNYLVEANRDLYKNFSTKYDSTEMMKNFHPKKTFSGEAVIWYWQKGLRLSYTINNTPVETQMKTR